MDSRRDFIKKSALTATTLSLAPGSLWARSGIAPSDQMNVALIGCRGKGFGLLKGALDEKGVNCLGMCDVDQNILDERAATVKENYGQTPKLYKDYRKLLEDQDIDAVFIGTPDHWHCLPTVTACEAAKDVYVEKPMANSLAECDVMVEAAQKYSRVVQVGQQQRSGSIWNNIMEFIKSDKLGPLRKVNLWANFYYGVGNKMKPDQPVPDGVDYDFWLGPAPDRSFNPTRYHGSWRMFWDYGGGLMTDWGVHLIDMALWAKDITTPPKDVLSYGKNLSFENYNHETFDTMSVVYPMEDYVINWQHTAGVQNGPYNMLYGVEFVGDHATIVADRGKWAINPEKGGDFERPEIQGGTFEGTSEVSDMKLHIRNFFECIKTRDTPVCPPEIGRNVAYYAHMANIAGRTGDAHLTWDNQKKKFTNSRKANEYIKPEYRTPWEFPEI